MIGLARQIKGVTPHSCGRACCRSPQAADFLRIVVTELAVALISGAGAAGGSDLLPFRGPRMARKVAGSWLLVDDGCCLSERSDPVIC